MHSTIETFGTSEMGIMLNRYLLANNRLEISYDPDSGHMIGRALYDEVLRTYDWSCTI